MRCCKRLLDRLVVVVVLIALGSGVSIAQGISVKQAEILENTAGVSLDARFDVVLSPSLEDALIKGVPLTFELSLDVVEPRWYWFNRHVIEIRQERKLTFNPLTRVYRFSLGSLYLDYPTLDEAMSALQQIDGMKVAGSGVFKKGDHYQVSLRLSLDTAMLPKPFQLDAISSNDWKLDSKSLQWNITP